MRVCIGGDPEESNRQYGARRFSDYVLCRAPKKDMIQAGPPMCSHYDQINRFLLRHLDDFHKGLTLLEEDFVIFELLQPSEVKGFQFLLKFFALSDPQLFKLFWRKVNRKLFGW